MNQSRWRLRRQMALADGFIMLFLIFFFMQLLVAAGLLPVQWLAGFLPGGATTVNQIFIQQIVQTMLMVGIVFLFLHLRGVTVQQIGLQPFGNSKWFIWSLLLGVVIFFAMLLVSAFMVSLFPQWAEPQAATEMIMQADGRWERFEVLFMVSVLAPFSEELLFRGYIYHSVRQHRSVFISVLIASLLFGAMHYDLFRLLPLTFVGVLFNIAVIRSESLWAAMIMHGVWNFMTASMVLAV